MADSLLFFISHVGIPVLIDESLPFGLSRFSNAALWCSFSGILELTRAYYDQKDEEQIVLLSNIYFYVSIVFSIPVFFQIFKRKVTKKWPNGQRLTSSEKENCPFTFFF